MSFEVQAEPQNGQPVDGRANALSINDRRSLIDLWRVLSKQRLIVLTVTLFCVALAAWYAFRTPPTYESVARIEIDPNGPMGSDLSSAFTAEEEDLSSLQTEIHVIESDSVLFQTAQNLNLIRLVRQGGKKDQGGAATSSAEITPGERRALVSIIRGGLSITLLPETRILEIHYSSDDPVLAAAVANQLMETYSDEELRTKYERTMHVSTWLQKRLEDLKEEASDTQRQLADYQRTHNIVGGDENSNLTIQTLEHVSGDLDDAEADRIMKEARMRDFDSLTPDMVPLMGDDPTLATLHTQLSDLQLQKTQLATKYGPNHPQMQQLDLQIGKIQTQINNEVELARRQVHGEYESALGLEGALRKRLGAQEDETYRLNEDVAQYTILRHQAELTRDLYDTLQMRLKQASVSAGLSAANITVVDRAEVPYVPVAPKKRTSLLLGLFGGLLLGCVLAFVVESIDDRLRTSEEVESASMLPSLAAIPHVAQPAAKPSKNGSEDQVNSGSQIAHQLITLRDPKSNGAESYRGMRSSL
jgi:succinoglycan biosynthesis transport protein ExoP